MVGGNHPQAAARPENGKYIASIFVYCDVFKNRQDD